MEENEQQQQQQPSRWGLFILPVFALAVYALVSVKNEQTNNFFRHEVKPISRTSMPPNFMDEMERKVIKCESQRPRGPVETFKPMPRPEPEQLVINDMDRSSLGGIIIKEVLQ